MERYSSISLSEVLLATDNFSEARKLGMAGEGSVYKGIPSTEGMASTVRLLKPGGALKYFKREVKIIKICDVSARSAGLH